MRHKLKIKQIVASRLIQAHLIFIFGFLSSLYLGEVTGSFLLYAGLVFATVNFLESDNFLYKFSLASIFPIAYSPIYLIFRGFYSKGPLTTYDYEIYVFIFYFLINLIKIRSISLIYKSKNLIDIYKVRELISASSGLILLIFFNLILFSKSLGNFVAWVSSGDSRNHVVLAYEVSKVGWLNPVTFLEQPISVGSFTGLIFSQVDQNLLDPSELLKFHLTVFTILWIIILGALGITFSAFTWEFLGSEFKKKNLPLMFAGLLPLISAISSTGIYDGFISASFSISIVTLLGIWLLKIVNESEISNQKAVIGFFIFFASLMSWSFITFFTMPIFLVGIWLLQRNSYNKKFLFDFSFWTALVIVVYFTNQSIFFQNLIYKAKLAYSATGAISVPRPEFFYFLIGILLLTAWFVSQIARENFIFFTLLSALFIFGVILFKWFGNLNYLEWNYYSLKLMWIIYSSVIGILGAFWFSYLAKLSNQKSGTPTRSGNFLLMLFVFFLIILMSDSVTPVKNPWMKVLKGWENPSASTMDKVLKIQSEFNTPTLFFDHGYNGESMLGNFWLNAYTQPIEPIRGWNYTIDTLGNVSQLCDVSAYYKKVNVITFNPELVNSLKLSCPQGNFSVTVENP